MGRNNQRVPWSKERAALCRKHNYLIAPLPNICTRHKQESVICILLVNALFWSHIHVFLLPHGASFLVDPGLAACSWFDTSASVEENSLCKDLNQRAVKMSSSSWKRSHNAVGLMECLVINVKRTLAPTNAHERVFVVWKLNMHA